MGRGKTFLIILFFLAVNLSGQTPIFSDDFESGNANNWQTFLYGNWVVALDKGDYSYKQTLHEIDIDNRLPLQAISVVKNLVVDNFQLVCYMRSDEDLTTEPKADFSYVFGFQDSLNYFKAFFNQTANVSVISRFENGIQDTLSINSTPLVVDTTYHKVTLLKIGTLLRVILDDETSFDVPNVDVPAGRVGVGVFDDAASFDDFTVYEPIDLLNISFADFQSDSFPNNQICFNVTDQLDLPIQNLTESNFTVIEDGVSATITEVNQVPAYQYPLSVSLLLDASDSMADSLLDDAKSAATTFVDQLSSSDKAAVVSFASSVEVEQDLISDKDLLNAAIQGITAGGASAMYDAIVEGINQIYLQPTRRAIILASDGVENASINRDLDDILADAQAADIPIYTIGLNSPELEDSTLQYIASQTGGVYYFAPSASVLEDIYLQLVDRFYNQYCLSFTSPNALLDCNTRNLQVIASVDTLSDTLSYSYDAPCSTQVAMFPNSSSSDVEIGQSFWLDINVGRVSNPVTDLFGIGFTLNLDDTSNISIHSPHSTSIVEGDFLGTDVVFFSDVQDSSTINMMNSRKYPASGVDGNGVVARVYFDVSPYASAGDSVQFSLSNIRAIDSNGDVIYLEPETFTVHFIEGDYEIWPGDTNNDGTVDMSDLLPIGMYYGLAGPSRSGAPNISWAGYECPSGWSMPALCFVDADGTGEINQQDALAIGFNWGQTHVLNKNSALAEAASMETDATLTGTLEENNDQCILQVEVENVADVFGLTFDVVAAELSDYVEFDSVVFGDFFSENALALDVIDNPRHKVSIGFSEKRGSTAMNGSGRLATVFYHLLPDAPADGSLQFHFTNVNSNSADGEPVEISTETVSSVLPVELSAFKARVVTDAVQLLWTTESETNNYGFEVERRFEKSGDWQRLGFVAGHGTRSSRTHYDYLDTPPTAGRYEYRLRQLDVDGEAEYSQIVQAAFDLPTAFKLHQNYPNPFNPSTVIEYEVAKEGDIRIEIYNALGRHVKTLVDQQQSVGAYTVRWDAVGITGPVSQGVYIVRMLQNNQPVHQIKLLYTK